MKRILVVNVNWLGDVIFSSPIFKALREHYPQTHICCLAVPRVKDILESIPHIDEIIVYDDRKNRWNLMAKLGLIMKLRARHFDIAILLHRSLSRALWVFFAGIPERVGYDVKGRGLFLTHKIEPLDVHVHRSDHYLDVIDSYGVTIPDRQCHLKATPDAEDDVTKFLSMKGISKDDFVIILNPGGNWNLKRWAPENFARLATGLRQTVQAKIIISGARKDDRLVAKIKELCGDRLVDVTGQTNLKQLIALMKRADLVISGDSGPLHIANSVGTEVIGLFGPTRPEVTGPKGFGKVHIIQHDLGCNREPCYHLRCPDNICMQSIIIEDVLEIVKSIKDR